jgi:hypothetical protein
VAISSAFGAQFSSETWGIMIIMKRIDRAPCVRGGCGQTTTATLVGLGSLTRRRSSVLTFDMWAN